MSQQKQIHPKGPSTTTIAGLIRQLFRAGRADLPPTGSRHAHAAIKRERGFSLEPLEPRLLLSADINYHPASNLTGEDYTLTAASATLLELRLTTGGALVTSGTLDASGVVNLHKGGTALVQSAASDTIRLNLSSLSNLGALSGVTSNLLDIRFVGGSQDIQRDHLILFGNTGGSLNFSLSLSGNADIAMPSGTLTLAASKDLTLASESSQTGLVNDLVGGAGDGFNFFSLNKMKITLGGSITADDVTLTASSLTRLTNGSLPSLGPLNLAFAYAEGAAEVELGGTLSANSLTASATSQVNASAIKAAETSSSSTDGSIAGLFLTSDARSKVLPGAIVSVTGALALNATNIATAAAIADGGSTVGGKGASLGVAVIGTAHDNDTRASIEAGSKVNAGSITVAAETQNTLAAVAKSTQGGAEGGVAPTPTVGAAHQSQTQLANNNANANGSPVSLAGAVAVGIVKSNTLAFVATNTAAGTGVTSTGAIAISARTVTNAHTEADGSATVEDGAGTNLGIAVAIGTAITKNDAYVTGSGALSAGGLSIQALMADRTLAFDLADVDDGASAESIALPGGASGLQAGDALLYRQGTNAITGLVDNVVYYAVPQANGTIRLAPTAPDAIAGTNLIALTKPGSGSGYRFIDQSHTSRYGVTAIAGASGGDTGVAGALALNVSLSDAAAYIDTNTAVTLTGAGALTIASENAVQSTVQATGKQAEAGKFGMGAAIALNIGIDRTDALVKDGASFGGAGDVTLSAVSKNDMATTATGGGAGKTAITPVLATTYAQNTVTASLGTLAAGSTLGGSLDVSASHDGGAATVAEGDTESGNTGVGISLALTIATDTALATTSRNVNAGGAVAFKAHSTAVNKSRAKASVAGGKDSPEAGSEGGVDNQVSSQRNAANTRANASRAGSGTASTTGASASGQGGAPVQVAGAVSVAVSLSTAKAEIPDGRSITAGTTTPGVVTVWSENNTDSSAKADASAVAPQVLFDPLASGVVDTTNHTITVEDPSVHTGDRVTYRKGDAGNTAVGGLADGRTYFARVTSGKISLYDTKAHAQNTASTTGRVNLSAGATGTGHSLGSVPTGTGVGIAVGVNVAKVHNIARLGDVTIADADGLVVQALVPTRDADDQTSSFGASATSGVSGVDTGIAGSLAINIGLSDSTASIADNASVTLSAGSDVALSAENFVANDVSAKASQSGFGKFGMGASIALNIGETDTNAFIGQNVVLNNADDVLISAASRNDMTTAAEGGAAGKTAITPVISISIADNDTQALVKSTTGATLTTSGTVTVSAAHDGGAITSASGDTKSGDTGVGVSLALTVATDDVRATTQRNLTAGGAVAFTAHSTAANEAAAQASVAGGNPSSPSSSNGGVNDQVSGQSSFAGSRAGSAGSGANTSNRPGATSASGQGTGSSSKVQVAGAVGVAVTLSSALAEIPDGRIVVGGNGASVTNGSVTVRSENNTDSFASADGSTTQSAVTFDPAGSVNATDHTITLPGSSTLKTGAKVTYSAGDGTAIGGLAEGVYYTRVKVDRATGDKVVKLFDTKAHAEAPATVNTGLLLISGPGTGSEHSLDADLDGTGVGVAVAVNVADVDNTARIGVATITADGAAVEALQPVVARTIAFDPTASGVVDTTAKTITVDAGHGLRNGDAVTYARTGGGDIGGLVNGTTYYAHVDGNTIQLYTSKAGAEAGGDTGRVALSSAGTGSDHTLSWVDTTSRMGATAVSGVSGVATGVAGSLALNIGLTESAATLAGGANVGITDGGDVTITAENFVENSASATASQEGFGKFGMGISLALNIGETDTDAILGTNTVLTGADDLTLSASSSNAMDTHAAGGAAGKTAITPVFALTVANNDTQAVLNAGAATTVTGALSASASHEGSNLTDAAGDTKSGDTGVGISIALNVVSDTAVATTARRLTSSGDMSFVSHLQSINSADAHASVAGQADEDNGGAAGGGVDGQVGSQQGFANDRASSGGASPGTTGSTSQGSSTTEGGPVAVAGAVSVSVVLATSRAAIPEGGNVTAGGQLRLLSDSFVETGAMADGSAVTTGTGTGVGVAVSVGYTEITNEAYVGAGATVDANGLDIRATQGQRTLKFTTTEVDVLDTDKRTLYVGMDSGLKTGDKRHYDANGGTEIGGLTAPGDDYYVRTEGAGRISLYDTKENAVAGEAAGQKQLAAGATGTGHKLEPLISDLNPFAKTVTFDPAANVRLIDMGDDGNLKTGDAVAYGAGAGAMGGLTNGATYYVIVVDGRRISLAASRDDAVAGKAIKLTSAGGAGQSFTDTRASFHATAVSGAGGGKTGVAGSVAINIAKDNTRAVVGYNADGNPPNTAATVLLTTGDVDIRAASRTENIVLAAPSGGGAKGSNVGVGASVALNIALNNTIAEIEDGEAVSGTAGHFIVTADADNAARTTAQNGASSDKTAVGAAIAIAIVENTTRAMVGNGSTIALVGNGELRIAATLADTVVTTAAAEAAGDKVAVGASVALNIVTDDTLAKANRSFSGAGAVTVAATSDLDTRAEAKGSAKGASKNKDAIDDANAPSNSRDSQSETNAQSGAAASRGGTTNKMPANSQTGGMGQANSNASSQSSNDTQSGGTSVAASVAVNYLHLDNKAIVAAGVSLVGSGALAVRADYEADASTQGISTSVNTSSKTGVAGAVGVNLVFVTDAAEVGAGATLQGSSVTVAAETLPGANNTAYSRALAGAVASNTAIGGSISLNYLDIDTHATVASNSGAVTHLTATAGSVTVSANDLNEIQNIAGGAAISTQGGTGVGIAIAVNIYNGLDTNASIGANAVVAATGGSVSVTSHATLAPKLETLPVIGTFGVSSFAAGIAASTGGTAIGGSSAVDVYLVETHAYIDDSATVTASQNITVSATDTIKLFSGAGGLAASTSGTGVGIGLDVGVIVRHTSAWVGNNASLTATAGNIVVDAGSDEDITSIAATFGLSASSVGVAASIAVQVQDTSTKAYVEDAASGQTSLHAGGKVAVTSNGALKTLLIAGGVGVGGGSAGVGIANTTLVHTDTVEARVGNRGHVTAAGSGGVEVGATSSEDLISITAAGGVGGTAGVAGAATIIVLDETTKATVGKGATVNAQGGASPGTGGSVNVHASDESNIVSVAGSLAAGGTAGVGVGADVMVVTKSTLAAMDSGVTSLADRDVSVTANSLEDVTSVSAGIAIGGTAGVSVNAGVHVLNVTTDAHIGDDPAAPSLAGAGDVHARGTVRIEADESTTINKVAAAAAVGGTVGVGAAATVTVIDKHTRAYVGAGAKVTGDGHGSGLLAATGGYAVGYTPEAAGDTTGIESSTLGSNSGATTTSLKAQGRVKAPNVNSVDFDNNAGDDASPATVGIRGATANKGLVRGVAVGATNHDDINTFSAAVAGGTVGVAVAAAVNVINTDTQAYVGSGAQVNGSAAGSNAAQSVSVAAANDFHHMALAAGLGVGMVGVAPGVDVTVMNATTSATLGTGSTVNARDDVSVNAFGAEDILLVGMGVGGGVVGVGGGVTVLVFNTSTQASVLGQVSSGGDTAVMASDSTKVFNLSGALGAGFVGVGASVGVLTIDKDTQAFVASGATVDAKGGGGTGVAGTFDGSMTGGDAADGFNGSARHGLVVQAASAEELLTVTVAAGAGFVGVSGAISVAVVNSNTKGWIGNAAINQSGGNAGASGNQDVWVNAANEFRDTTFTGAIAGGFVGVGGAIDVGVLKNNVNAQILSGARVTAAHDVKVNALAIKEIDSYVLSGAGGFVGVAGAISVWSIGDSVANSYQSTDKEGNKSGTPQNPLMKQKEDGSSQSADQDAATQGDSGKAKISGNLSAFGSSSTANTTDGKQSSDERISSISATGAARLNATGSTAASVAAKLAAGVSPTDKGTNAKITGATVTTGNDLVVYANEDVEFDITMGAVGVGAVGVGASIGVDIIKSNVSASAGGTLVAGNQLRVASNLDQDVHVLSVAGGGGFVGLGAAVVVIVDVANSTAQIESGSTVNGAASVVLDARANEHVTGRTIGAAIGAAAAGASFVLIDMDGDVGAVAGDNVRFGNTAQVGSVTITADAAVRGEADVWALAGGLGYAITGNFAVVDVTPVVRAEFNGLSINASGAVSVSANASPSARAETFGIAVGAGLSAGMSFARANASPTVTASVTGTINAGSLLVSATQTVGNAGYTARSKTIGSSGGLVGLDATVSYAQDNATVTASVADGSTLVISGTTTVSALNNSKQQAIADSNAGGLLALGISRSHASSGATTTAELGTDVKLTGRALTVNAIGVDDNYADTVAGSVGAIAGASATAITVNNSTTTSRIKNRNTAGRTIDVTGGTLPDATGSATYTTDAVGARTVANGQTVDVLSGHSGGGDLGIRYQYVGQNATYTSDVPARLNTNDTVDVLPGFTGSGTIGMRYRYVGADIPDSVALVDLPLLRTTNFNSADWVLVGASRRASASIDLGTENFGNAANWRAVGVVPGAGPLSVLADHTARFNGKIWTLAGGLLSGSGADMSNTVTATVRSEVGNNADITAKSISVQANDRTDKPLLSGPNIKSTSGGFITGGGAFSHTTINLDTLVDIASGAKLNLVGSCASPGAFTLASLNDIVAKDKVAFTAGGLGAALVAESTIVSEKDWSKVHIGSGAQLLSLGQIDISARGQADAQALIEAEAYGAGTYTGANAELRLYPTNTVTIDAGALVHATRDLNVYAGASRGSGAIGYVRDGYTMDARSDTFAGSLIPIDDVNSTTILSSTNRITIAGGGTLLETAGDARLHAEDDGFGNLTGSAKAVSWVSALQDALNGAAAAEMNDATIHQEAHGTVQVDGTVRTGIERNKELTLTAWNDTTGKVTVPAVGAGNTGDITFTSTRETVQSSLVGELAFANEQLALYAALNPTLKAFYEGEVVRIQAKLADQGLFQFIFIKMPAHGFSNNQVVNYTAGSDGTGTGSRALGGLISGQSYSVKVLNANQFGLFQVGDIAKKDIAMDPTKSTATTHTIGGKTFTLSQLDGLAKGQSAITVTVDPITAKAGKIDIVTDELQGSGVFDAPADAKVTIANHTPAFIKLQGVDIPDSLGGVYVNGQPTNQSTLPARLAAINAQNANAASFDNRDLVTGEGYIAVGNAAFAGLTVTTTSLPAETPIAQRPQISVVNDFVAGQYIGSDPSHYGADYAWPNIVVSGAVNNFNGLVHLETLQAGNGSILVNAPVHAYRLELLAGGDVSVDLSDIPNSQYAVGNEPSSLWGGVTAGTIAGDPTVYNGVADAEVGANATLTAAKVAAVTSLLATPLPTTPGLQGDRVYVTAQYINLNGLIKSGDAQYTLTLGAQTNTEIANLNGQSGVLSNPEVKNSHFIVRWDAVAGAIVVNDVVTSGGYVDITGHVLNTGKGKIEVLGGYAAVNVTNNTGKKLVMNRVDNSDPGQGVVIIKDSAKGSNASPYVTLYKDTNGVVTKTENAGIQNNVNDTDQTFSGGTPTTVGTLSQYAPDTGWRYGWTVGATTEIQKYVHKDVTAWIGIDWLSVDPDTIAWDSVTVIDPPPKVMPDSAYYFKDTGLAADRYTYVSVDRELSNETYILDKHVDTTWYGKSTYHNEIKNVQRHLYTYTHTIKADYPIDVQFTGATTGTVNVTSNSPIELRGLVSNPSGPTAITSTTGSITAQTTGAVVSGNTVSFDAKGQIGTAAIAMNTDVQSNAGSWLSAVTTYGQININETTGDLKVNQVTTPLDLSFGSGEAVTLRAQNGIVASSGSSLVRGGAITLEARSGVIGASGSNLRIDGGNPISNALTASATGNIFLEEIAGNMNIRSITTTGDVTVTVDAGGIVDANIIETRDVRAYETLKGGAWADLGLTNTATDSTNNASAKVQATKDTLADQKDQEYQTYWSFRNSQPQAPLSVVTTTTLTAGKTYYVIVSGNDVRLAASQSDAVLGKGLDLSDAATSGLNGLSVGAEVLFNTKADVENPIDATPAALTAANDTVTLLSSGFVTGDAVVYRRGSSTENIGLVDGRIYYVTDVSDTTHPNRFKLKADPADAGFVAIAKSTNAASHGLLKVRTFDGQTGVDAATDKITLGAGHGHVTGNAVVLGAKTGASPVRQAQAAPLVDGQTYYLIAVDATHVQLSATNGGPALDLLNTGASGAQQMLDAGTTKLLFNPLSGVDNATDRLTVQSNALASGTAVVYRASVYDATFTPPLSVGEDSFYRNDLGYNQAAIDALLASRKAQYATLHARWGTNHPEYANPIPNGDAYFRGVANFNPGTAVSIGSDTITLANGHGLKTGTRVSYQRSDGADVGGLAGGSGYFANVSGNTVKLYDTQAHANAGGAAGRVNLTTLGSGSAHSLKWNYHYALSPAEIASVEASIHVYSEQELWNAIGAGMLKDVTSTLSLTEAPNIDAHKITLITSVGIGTSTGSEIIDVSGGAGNLTDDQRVLLSAAERTDVAFLGLSVAVSVSVDGPSHTITRSSGSWVLDGFGANQRIAIAGSGPNVTADGLYHLITAITPTVLTLAAAPLATQGTTALTFTPEIGKAVVTAAGTVQTVTAQVTIDDATNTITRAAGSWIADGFQAGLEFRVSGSSPNATPSGVTYKIASVTATTLTLQATALTNETGVTLTFAQTTPMRVDVNASAKTLTRAYGSWLGDGFQAGLKIRIGGENANQTAPGVTWQIVSVTASTLTLGTASSGSAVLVNETGATMNVTQVNPIKKIVISKRQDVNVAGLNGPTAALKVAAHGDVFISSDVVLPIDSVTTDGDKEIRLKSKAGITNVNASVTAVDIAGGDTILEGGSGGVGSATRQINIDLATSKTITARAHDPIYLYERAGDMAVGTMFSEVGGVYLTSVGSIVDGLNSGLVPDFTKIRASHIDLRALNGTIGEVGDFLEIDAVGAATIVANATGSIWLDETDGNMNVESIVATAGDVTLRAIASILDANGTGGVDVSGNSITLTATLGAVGVIGNDLDIDTHGSGLLKSTSAFDTVIIEVFGDLRLDQVGAGAAYTSFLTAPTGNIVNGRATGSNVLSGKAYIVARDSIGTAAKPLTSEVGGLEGKSILGSTNVVNTGGMVNGGVVNSGDPGQVSGSSITVTTQSPQTVGENAVGAGPITFTSTDHAAAGDDLTVAGGVIIETAVYNFVTHTWARNGSTIALRAGDNLTRRPPRSC